MSNQNNMLIQVNDGGLTAVFGLSAGGVIGLPTYIVPAPTPVWSTFECPGHVIFCNGLETAGKVTALGSVLLLAKTQEGRFKFGELKPRTIIQAGGDIYTDKGDDRVQLNASGRIYQGEMLKQAPGTVLALVESQQDMLIKAIENAQPRERSRIVIKEIRILEP